VSKTTPSSITPSIMMLGATPLLAITSLLLIHPSSCLATVPPSSPLPVETLLTSAQSFVDDGNSVDAFDTLAQVYAQDPNAPGLSRLFEACLRLKVEDGSVQDHFGLAALLLDQERYEEASVQLGHILEFNNDENVSVQVLEKAASMLFRSNAACCQWKTYVEDSQKLVESLRLVERQTADTNPNDVPAVHPFEALKWPCISLKQATQIAALYARRSIASVTDAKGSSTGDSLLGWKETTPPTVTVSRETDAKLSPTRRIRLGYISPDFTSTHPLAFLMQHVFQHHDREKFEVKLYSLSKWDEEGNEVQAIQNGSDSFTVLPAESPDKLAKQIEEDELDILVDLCGYAGTDRISQILAHRPAPLQVSYMGFPASSGSPNVDYLVCDQTVVPPELRNYYTELLIHMPHCYFVNSHVTSVSHLLVQEEEIRRELRKQYNLPPNAFVYCCHSRPDKIDPSTFRTWLRALTQARQECGDNKELILWLLRSGSEMEANLCQIAQEEFGLPKEALVFCDVAPREEHLRRLACADVFLDTPAYNAHTLGVDTLFAGVPMISLLRHIDISSVEQEEKPMDPLFVDTEKLASRVGASLLQAAGLDDMVCERMRDYAQLMVKCATDEEWFASTRARLAQSRSFCPLFDTRRWVENLELAFRQIVLDKPEECDIVIIDDTEPVEE
jgi:predicted O-linked N-acetylglucosamine transferase (SPINDLY family)